MIYYLPAVQHRVCVIMMPCRAPCPCFVRTAKNRSAIEVLAEIFKANKCDGYGVQSTIEAVECRRNCRYFFNCSSPKVTANNCKETCYILSYPYMSMYLPAQLPICPQKDSWAGRNQLDQLSLTSIGVRLCILQLKNRVHAGVGVVAHVSDATLPTHGRY